MSNEKHYEANEDGTFTERTKVSGEKLKQTVEGLRHDASVRKIVVKDRTGRVRAELPLSAGVVGGALAIIWAPFLTAVALLGSVLAEVTIEIVRDHTPASDHPQNNQSQNDQSQCCQSETNHPNQQSTEPHQTD